MLQAGSEPTWTLEIMMEDFLSRSLMKDIVVKPTPAVSGTTPPEVHSNLYAVALRTGDPPCPLCRSPPLWRVVSLPSLPLAALAGWSLPAPLRS